jgi:hypothetical protein
VSEYNAAEKLTIQDLRSKFNADEAQWLLYRRKDGTVGIQAPTKRGTRNYDAALARGCKAIGMVVGVSRKEALRAAKTAVAK